MAASNTRFTQNSLGQSKNLIDSDHGIYRDRPLPATRCHRVIVAIESHQGALHMQISTIGLDIAKNVFQVHGIDAKEKVVARKQLRRSQMIKIRVCDQPADGQGTW